MQHDVIVITHDCISTNVNRKNLCQLEDSGFDPAATMFKIIAGYDVLTTQKRATDTATHAMVVRSEFGVYES